MGEILVGPHICLRIPLFVQPILACAIVAVIANVSMIVSSFFHLFSFPNRPWPGLWRGLSSRCYQIVFLVDQRSVFLAQCVQWFTPSYAVRLQPEQYPIKDRFAPVMVIACCPPRDQSRPAASSNTMK